MSFLYRRTCSLLAKNACRTNINHRLFSSLQSSSKITTKSVRIHEPGSVDALTTETIELPDLTDGQILIKNQFAGLNFIDTYQRSGLYKVPLPSTLGVDGAGVIAETTPKAVSEFNLNIGDRISYYDLGSYSQYKVLPGEKAIPIPNNIACDMAVASTVQGMTAHYLLMSTFELKKSDICVIHAGAGGVGQILTQIAANVIGCETIITTASSEQKRKYSLSMGAHYSVPYDEVKDCVDEVTQRKRGAKGVDVVYDGVGKNTYQTSMTLLRPRGLCVFYGNASGAIPDINPLLLSQMGSIYITRCILGHYIASRDDLLARAGDLFYWIGENQVKFNIDQVFTLDEVKKAHEYIEGGNTTGKVVFDCQK